MHSAAGPWFTVHRVGEGWKTPKNGKIWISNGRKSNIAVVQLRVRFADDKDIYQDDALNTSGFDYPKELANARD